MYRSTMSRQVNTKSCRLVLAGGDQRMSDCVNGERNPVLHTNFAHQLGDVGLHRTLFDSEDGADFLIGSAGYQELQNFFLTIGECDAPGGKDASGRRGHAIDED